MRKRHRLPVLAAVGAVLAVGLGVQARPAQASSVYPMIRNWNNLCLDAEGGGRYNGTSIVQWGCEGYDNQLWKFGSRSSFNGAQQIQLYNTGPNWGASAKCLDVPGDNFYDGAPIQLWDCHGQSWGTTNQHWHVDGPEGSCNSSGCLYRSARNGDYCIDIPAPDTRTYHTWGTRVTIWRCEGSSNQRFTKYYT